MRERVAVSVLENLVPPAPKVQPPKGWTPAVEIDGDEGWAVTPGFPVDEKPNFEDFLVEAGFDPNEIEVVGTPRTSRWQRYDGLWLTSYRFNFRKIAGQNINLPALLQEVKKTKPPLTKQTESGKALVVMVADLQVGKSDYRGGTKELLPRVYEAFARVEAKAKSGKYETIVLADMGDIVEGFSNQADQQQTYSNDLSLMQQVDLAAALLWDLMKRLTKFAPVTYLTVASNHCQFRISKQQVGKPGLDDWGVVIAQQLARLAKEVGLPVKVLVPEPHDESLAFDVFGDGFHVLGLWHGHQSARPDNVPTWWRQQAFGSQPVAGATIGLTGHFHHLRITELGQAPNGGSRWWIQSPTLDNGSGWWRLTAGEDSQPGLAVFELEKQKHYSGTVFKL